MRNYELIEKIKSELSEIELYDQTILAPNDFMERIEKIFKLLDKIKDKN